MRNTFRNILVLVILFISQLASAQQVITAEYFWDTDPGLGSATPITALDGNLDEAIEDLFTSSVSIPTPGLHTFNIRIKGLENTWSSLFSYVINVGSQVLSTGDLQVIQAEYFWDTDPGLGSATPILALDGNLDEAIEELFTSSVSIPSVGLHTFNIRIKGVDNSWSNAFSYVINVGSPTLISRNVEVTQGEYYWDTDPGAGSATPILAFDGNFDEALENLFDGSIPSPSAGIHTFNLRVKGFDGSWSSSFAYVINVENGAVITRDAKVTQAEYFWDTDPGVGNATVILALDGNLDEAIENLFESTVSIPSNGAHTFNIRVKGFDNSWSSTFSYVINVGTPTEISRDMKVIQAEYFWDTDPGLGSANPILALDGNLDEAVEDVFQNTLVSTTIGLHVFNLRVKGEDNTWSSTFRYVVDVLDSNSYNTINPVICAGSSYTVPSGSASYTTAGIYSDTLVNANGFDSILTINLFVDAGTASTINLTECGTYLSPAGNTYTSSGTYIDVIPNSSGCDSTITINLTILPNSLATISVGVCDSYTSPSGNYTWTSSGTYQDTIPNALGCDSVLTINLTISTATSSTQTVVACNSYTWAANGTTYTVSGSHTATLLNAIGCDSIVTLDLTINYGFSNTTTLVVCDSYTWPITGSTYTATGIYVSSQFNVNGCDSSYILDLTVKQSTSSSQTVTACDSYTWPVTGMSYSTSGAYSTTLVNALGCDSIITLNLTINNGSEQVTNVSACNSYTWAENGVTYTNAGVYSEIYTNAVGCDSIITLNLNLGQQSNTTANVAACNSYYWTATGITYTTSGFHTANLLTPQGCDSIVNLNLVVNYSSSSTQNLTACDSYTWPITGATYTSSGTYFGTTTTSLGCDSTITLNLTIKNSSGSSQNVTSCNSYFWSTNGSTYTTSGVYTATFTNAVGCDSVVTLNLTIGNDYTNTAVVSECDNYVWAANGVNYTSSGLYTVNLLTAEGCDSILNLDLTINTSTTASVTVTECDLYTWPLNGNSYATSGIYFATFPNAAGCDSTVTLYLTITNSASTFETVTACNNYTWPTNGVTYSASGTYTSVLPSANGCDSLVTLNLTIDYGFSTTDVISACNSYTWPINGATYTNSGMYSVNGFTTLGCDSSYYLDLTINTNTTSTQTETSCGPYTWSLNGTTYSTSGSYATTVVGTSGCDSTVTLDLTVNSNSSSSESVSACGSYFWPASGLSYTNSGTYSATLTNAAGCDSVLTLNLTLANGFTNTASITSCGDYTWGVNGTTYSNSGVYTASYIGSNGCDSVYTLNLNIGNPLSSSTSISACNSYFWALDGQTYTNSGTYTTTLTNTSGCDSVVTLNLVISSGSSSSQTITACNSYFWSGTNQTYTSSGTYTATLVGQGGCDSTVTLNLTINTVNAQIFQTDNILTTSPSNGTYEWLNCATGGPIVGQNGQEFIAMTNGSYAAVVTVNGCSDTTSCVTVDNADIDKHFLESLSLYPNPTDGKFTIDLGDFKDLVTLTFRDVRGRLLQTTEHTNVETIELFVEYPTGMYFLEITSNNENAVLRLVLK